MSTQEFKVGQQVSGEDYKRLPVGSVVEQPGGGDATTKTAPNLWRDEVSAYQNCQLHEKRTLTHLPTVTLAEPESPTEPFGWALPDGKTVRINEACDLGVTFGESVVAGEVPVWLTQDSGLAIEPLADWERALLEEVDDENAVTINTLDREEIHRFIACLPADWGLIDERDGSTPSETVDQVIEALREFANPTPVVSEPTGLGAVVVATFASDRPVTWVRISRGGGAPWRAADVHNPTTEVLWSQLDIITVLSEGWTEDGA